MEALLADFAQAHPDAYKPLTLEEHHRELHHGTTDAAMAALSYVSLRPDLRLTHTYLLNLSLEQQTHESIQLTPEDEERLVRVDKSRLMQRVGASSSEQKAPCSGEWSHHVAVKFVQMEKHKDEKGNDIWIDKEKPDIENWGVFSVARILHAKGKIDKTWGLRADTLQEWIRHNTLGTALSLTNLSVVSAMDAHDTEVDKKKMEDRLCLYHWHHSGFAWHDNQHIRTTLSQSIDAPTYRTLLQHIQHHHPHHSFKPWFDAEMAVRRMQFDFFGIRRLLPDCIDLNEYDAWIQQVGETLQQDWDDMMKTPLQSVPDSVSALRYRFDTHYDEQLCDACKDPAAAAAAGAGAGATVSSSSLLMQRMQEAQRQQLSKRKHITPVVEESSIVMEALPPCLVGYLVNPHFDPTSTFTFPHAVILQNLLLPPFAFRKEHVLKLLKQHEWTPAQRRRALHFMTAIVRKPAPPSRSISDNNAFQHYQTRVQRIQQGEFQEWASLSCKIMAGCMSCPYQLDGHACMLENDITLRPSSFSSTPTLRVDLFYASKKLQARGKQSRVQ
jgi:hypothetical protein